MAEGSLLGRRQVLTAGSVTWVPSVGALRALLRAPRPDRAPGPRVLAGHRQLRRLGSPQDRGDLAGHGRAPPEPRAPAARWWLATLLPSQDITAQSLRVQFHYFSGRINWRPIVDLRRDPAGDELRGGAHAGHGREPPDPPATAPPPIPSGGRGGERDGMPSRDSLVSPHSRRHAHDEVVARLGPPDEQARLQPPREREGEEGGGGAGGVGGGGGRVRHPSLTVKRRGGGGSAGGRGGSD